MRRFAAIPYCDVRIRFLVTRLRGERNHCKMASIPTFTEEDTKRPHRERETLVGEQTIITNRIKATLARLGIRNSISSSPQRRAIGSNDRVK